MGTILIVDDSEHVRDKLSDLLQNNNHMVITAENGDSGLNSYTNNKQIDLIITDLNMPVMNGLKMCEEISKVQDRKRPPILVLSSEADPDLKETMKTLGVVAWIIKPFKEEVVSSVIDQIIQKHRAG